MAKISKLAIKNIYIRIIKHYTDIDPTVNTHRRQKYIFTKLYKYVVHVYTIIQMCSTCVQNYTSV
jgi:hypothetical protein